MFIYFYMALDERTVYLNPLHQANIDLHYSVHFTLRPFLFTQPYTALPPRLNAYMF